MGQSERCTSSRLSFLRRVEDGLFTPVDAIYNRVGGKRGMNAGKNEFPIEQTDQLIPALCFLHYVDLTDIFQVSRTPFNSLPSYTCICVRSSVCLTDLADYDRAAYTRIRVYVYTCIHVYTSTDRSRELTRLITAVRFCRCIYMGLLSWRSGQVYGD